MEDGSRKHGRGGKHGTPLRALHIQQSNSTIWKRKRGANPSVVPQEIEYPMEWDRSSVALKRPKRFLNGFHNNNDSDGQGCERDPMDFVSSDDYDYENYGLGLRTAHGVGALESPRTCIDVAEQPQVIVGGSLDSATSPSRVKCIFCRKWSGDLEDFAWHVSQAHGIPQHVAVSIIRGQSKLKNREFFGSLLEESISSLEPCNEYY